MVSQSGAIDCDIKLTISLLTPDGNIVLTDGTARTRTEGPTNVQTKCSFSIICLVKRHALMPKQLRFIGLH